MSEKANTASFRTVGAMRQTRVLSFIAISWYFVLTAIVSQVTRAECHGDPVRNYTKSCMENFLDCASCIQDSYCRGWCAPSGSCVEMSCDGLGESDQLYDDWCPSPTGSPPFDGQDCIVLSFEWYKCNQDVTNIGCGEDFASNYCELANQTLGVPLCNGASIKLDYPFYPLGASIGRIEKNSGGVKVVFGWEDLYGSRCHKFHYDPVEDEYACAADDNHIIKYSLTFNGPPSTPNTPAPVSSPPTAPAPAPSPFTPSPTAQCPEEWDAYKACVQSTGDAAACESCMTTYYPDSLASCNELEQAECGLAQACPECGTTCQDELLDYVNCLNAGLCDLITCPPSDPVPNAPSTPAPSPTPPSSASPTLECPEKVNAYVNCVESTGNASACQSCLTAYYPDSYSSCDDLESYVCGEQQACPDCGTCQDERVDLTNCLNERTCALIACPGPDPAPSPAPVAPSPISIPTGSPTLRVDDEPTRSPAANDDEPPVEKCLSQEDIVMDCLSHELSQADAADCKACMEEAPNGASSAIGRSESCQDLSDSWCSAFQARCGCGTCVEALRNYAGCVIDVAITGCQLDCPQSTSGGADSAEMHSVLVGHGLAALLLSVFVLL